MASNSSSPSIDPIYRWLRHVDEQISPGESVEFLKLPLYPFLRVEYAVAQELKTPSEIYNFLLGKYFHRDKEKTLYWFARALRLLGGDLRGDYLVGEKCLSQYRISLPSAPSDEKNPELQFFECITKIARKARGYNLEEGLKDRFSGKRHLNVNPRHLRHLPDLFVRLVQNQIISQTNTYYLHKALLRLSSKRAMQCLLYLNEYHKSVGLDEIADAKDIKKDPQTSAFENSCTASSDPGAAISKSYKKYRRHARNEHKVNRAGPAAAGNLDESMKTLDLESEATSTTDSEVSSEDTFDSTPRQPRPNSSARGKRALCLCWPWIIAIVVTVAIIVSLGSTVWRWGLFTPRKLNDTYVYNNSAVIIGELNQYYDSQIMLTPLPGIPLRDGVVGIYRFNSSCDRLPTQSRIIHWQKTNISGDQNYTHLYLLPGSTLNYTISLVNRNSVSVVHVNTDNQPSLHAELENVKVYVYITHGPEREEFDSIKCQLQSTSDCTIVYNKPITYNQHENSYVVDHDSPGRGYYNFHSVDTDPQYRYTLDLTINATTVDLKHAQHVCNISDINEGESSCNHEVGFKFEANRLVCFVASIEYEGNPGRYVILHADVSKQLKWILRTSVAPPAVVLPVIFVCLIICTIIKLCCCK